MSTEFDMAHMICSLSTTCRANLRRRVHGTRRARRFHNDAAGRQLSVLQDVYKSESDTNQRNQAIGALMLAYGYIKDNWQQAVDLYTRQCSIGVNARDLAAMAACGKQHPRAAGDRGHFEPAWRQPVRGGQAVGNSPDTVGRSSARC